MAGTFLKDRLASITLMKYDINDVYRWTKETGSIATENVIGMAVDPTGIYMFGITYGALPSNRNTPNAGLNDLLVMKFDANPSTAPSDQSDSLIWSVQQVTVVDDMAGGIVLVRKMGAL